MNEIQKKQLIEFDNYFTYNGEIEEYKKERDWDKNKVIHKEINSNDPIVKFYFENSDYTMDKIAKVFGLSGSCVRVRIGNYLNNNKIKF